MTEPLHMDPCPFSAADTAAIQRLDIAQESHGPYGGLQLVCNLRPSGNDSRHG